MSETTLPARQGTCGSNSAVIAHIRGLYAPITEDIRTGTAIIDTPAQFSLTPEPTELGATTPEDKVIAANEEFAKTTGRAWSPPSAQSQLANYEKACEDRALSEENKQPFIYEGFSNAGDFFLSRGMTLVGACPGSSKSTTAANLLAGFIRYRPNTKAVVVSNEESTDAVIHRTACVLLEKSYMAFHKGEMSRRDADSVRDTARKLLSRVIIVADKDWDTTCFEDVTTILKSCVLHGISMVVMDYYQTICHSRLEPELDHFKVLKLFGKFIREYGKDSPIPVVVFCQLAPKSSAPEFQSRVQYDKTIYNDAFNVIEIEPDFETKLTTFHIRKQRFGTSQGTQVVLKFENGRYVHEPPTESL